jgi:uncharacterized protein DUF4190
MRFCQSDGTPLVDDAPPLDPYKTMVARPADIAAAMPPRGSEAPLPDLLKDEEVLQLPDDSDPLKTMYASEEEIRREMNALDAADEPVMDLPPLAPEPPRFSEPSLSPPSFGGLSSPPPSPFSPSEEGSSSFGDTAPPISSPFRDPEPAAPELASPNFAQFKDPDPIDASSNPFDPPKSSTPEWTPPSAMEPGNQGSLGVSPSSYNAEAGQSKVLAIVSLVLGILSMLCCVSIITGPAAAIVGYVAKNKAAANPSEYGGSSLALAGIITGIIGTLIGVAALVFQIFFGGLNALMNM